MNIDDIADELTKRCPDGFIMISVPAGEKPTFYAFNPNGDEMFEEFGIEVEYVIAPHAFEMSEAGHQHHLVGLSSSNVAGTQSSLESAADDLSLSDCILIENDPARRGFSVTLCPSENTKVNQVLSLINMQLIDAAANWSFPIRQRWTLGWAAMVGQLRRLAVELTMPDTQEDRQRILEILGKMSQSARSELLYEYASRSAFGDHERARIMMMAEDSKHWRVAKLLGLQSIDLKPIEHAMDEADNRKRKRALEIYGIDYKATVLKLSIFQKLSTRLDLETAQQIDLDGVSWEELKRQLMEKD